MQDLELARDPHTRQVIPGGTDRSRCKVLSPYEGNIPDGAGPTLCMQALWGWLYGDLCPGRGKCCGEGGPFHMGTP